MYRTQKPKGDRETIMTKHRMEAAVAAEAICPVRALVHLVARFGNYKVDKTKWKHSADRPVNIVRADQTVVLMAIISTQVLYHIWVAAVQSYGKDSLGFPFSTEDDRNPFAQIGSNNSIVQSRGSGRNNKTDYTLERDAFMRYIRTQVQQITKGVATEMKSSPEIVTIGQV
ncbi:hypothetical protein MHU86_6302 [Fragilaria crotonensis]|nr:hypothetical protein MHU86_6302 [Fragilaria crotonensis]